MGLPARILMSGEFSTLAVKAVPILIARLSDHDRASRASAGEVLLALADSGQFVGFVQAAIEWLKRPQADVRAIDVSLMSRASEGEVAAGASKLLALLDESFEPIVRARTPHHYIRGFWCNAPGPLDWSTCTNIS